jgi:hypothetical protein
LGDDVSLLGNVAVFPFKDIASEIDFKEQVGSVGVKALSGNEVVCALMEIKLQSLIGLKGFWNGRSRVNK